MIRIALLVISLLALAGATSAQTPTRDRVDDLKERIATKVAELRQTQEQALSGTVSDITVSTISIETQTKEVKIELNDDILVYQILRGRRTKLAIDDVDENDFVVVFGDHDATLDVLSAKLIFIQALPPERISGILTQVDRDENTFTVRASGDRSVIIDFERTTVANVWSKEAGITKAGFSRLVVGDTVHVQGRPVAKQENRLTATRILDLGNITGAPTEAPSPTPTPRATRTPTPEP